MLQRLVSSLPIGAGPIYRLLQTTAGRQRGKADPRDQFQQLGITPSGARAMEVGTGWGLDMPIAFFLSGSASVKTFDLHPYLRHNRVAETASSIKEHLEDVRSIFAPYTEAAGLDDRLNKICKAETSERRNLLSPHRSLRSLFTR
jgi:hypothetical protein